MSRRISILYDLKPALDGYAGIPQETRLLFDALTQLDGIDIEGLIQHGSRQLRPGIKDRHLHAPASFRINRASRFIVSMHEKSRPIGGGELLESWKASQAEFLLQVATTLKIRQTLSLFEGRLFSDFIWKYFFDKTLDASRRTAITSRSFRVLSNSRAQYQRVGLRTASETKVARFPTVNTEGFELVLAQNPFSGAVSPGSKLLVRYHDAVPLLYPHTIGDKSLHQAVHYQALRANISGGAHFCCISRATESDLLGIFPQLEGRTSVIPNIVSPSFAPEPTDIKRVISIIDARQAPMDGPQKERQSIVRAPTVPAIGTYLLMVSTIEPRKNHKTLLKAWQRYRQIGRDDLKLILVGSLGWDHKDIVSEMEPWIRRGELFHLKNVEQSELSSLYSNAVATVCPSVAEGFDYSGVEAMLCDCPVMASDIPVHREVFQDAAVYFDPYSAENIMSVFGELLPRSQSAARNILVAKGQTVARQYTREAVAMQWQNLLRSLVAPRPTM